MATSPLYKLQQHITKANHAFASSRQFLKENMWRLLAWPFLALVVTGFGWYVLYSQLDSKRETIEKKALQDVQILADGYADEVTRAIDTIEQAMRMVTYHWETTGDHVQLGFSDERGLFVHATRTHVYLINTKGKVLTTTAPSLLSSQVTQKILEQVRSGMQVHFLMAPLPKEGVTPARQRLLFARGVTDPDGNFAGAVIVAVDPAYFASGYSSAIYHQDGLLAIVSDDGKTNAVRMESSTATVRRPDFILTTRFPVSSGSALLPGPQWFTDGQDRIVGWKHLDRRGATVLVGFTHKAILDPYVAMRATWIRAATFITAGLVLLTLIVLSHTFRFARRDHELNLIRNTYRMATEASNEGFYMTQPIRHESGTVQDFKIIDCNRRAAELIARNQPDVIGKCISELYAGEVFQARLNILRNALETGYQEVALERPYENFPSKWVQLRMVRYGENLAVSAWDITKERAHEEELLRRSNEDALTGLPNRYWLETHLAEAVSRAQEQNERLALLFVDIDGFKGINDTWGHAAGDEALCIAAKRLKDVVRPHDCVGRFGGDEFLILLPNLSGDRDAVYVSDRVLKAFRNPLELSYGDYTINASIGISIYPTDGKEARILLQYADIAMYSVKTAGGGSYRFFNMQFCENLKARAFRMRELRYALENDEFFMYYQPRARLSDGMYSSFEALVRWVHPERGMISPAEFTPLAEESGLILKLGEMVIEKVCAQLALWEKKSADLRPVSINISPRQFNETDVAGTLANALERHHIRPDLIEVELTESSVINDTDRALRMIRRIQGMGVKVLLDDFGTGYSSLSQLYNLKFDGLKIDRAFVLRLESDEDARAIIRAIITMARALGMHVVAEGIETAEQAAVLRSLGCDEIQGYMVSRPAPAADTQLTESVLMLVG